MNKIRFVMTKRMNEIISREKKEKALENKTL